MSEGFRLEVPTDALDRLVETIVERVRADLPTASPWLNRKAAAEYLDVPVSRLERDRSVPHHRWDGRVIYNARELDEWMKSR